MVNIIRKISNFNHSAPNNIKFIVIHDTGNETDTAQANANYFCACDRQSSAHYFVDDNVIYQVVEDSEGSWHCGDGHGQFGITNHNSIGIEMCRRNNNVTSKTEENTIALVKILMKKYNIPSSNVKRHYDASRKICPQSFSRNNWERWTRFKAKLVQNFEAKDGKWYKVQCGAYKDKRNAQNMMDKLYKIGQNSCILPEDGMYKVQAGAFRNKDNAYELSEKLKSAGIDNYVKIYN